MTKQSSQLTMHLVMGCDNMIVVLKLITNLVEGSKFGVEVKVLTESSRYKHVCEHCELFPVKDILRRVSADHGGKKKKKQKKKKKKHSSAACHMIGVSHTACSSCRSETQPTTK